MIGRVEVEHIAELARLELGEEEIQGLQRDLSRILGYVAQLNELDTAQVLPTSHVTPQGDVLREDLPRPSLPVEGVLANAPRAEEGYFRVQAVLPRGER